MTSKRRVATLRVALIGCGEHSREVLIPTLAAVQPIQVVAVCDIDHSAASFAASRFPNSEPLTDFAKAIDDYELDAIIVSATPQVHYHAALKALQRGLHVFLEKPPTVTKKELQRLVTEAKKSGCVTCVGHNLRHSEAALAMKRFLDASMGAKPHSSVFGRPLAMEMRYFASKPRGDRWGLESPLRSFLLSHANHAIDFMIYQMGPIDRVNAALTTNEKNGLALSVQFVFQTGAVGNLLATSAAPFFAIAGTVISETNHVIHLDSLDSVTAFGFAGDPKRHGHLWVSRTLQTGYEHAGYATELHRFATACLRAAPRECGPSFEDELAVYDALHAIENILGTQRTLQKHSAAPLSVLHEAGRRPRR